MRELECELAFLSKCDGSAAFQHGKGENFTSFFLIPASKLNFQGDSGGVIKYLEITLLKCKVIEYERYVVFCWT